MATRPSPITPDEFPALVGKPWRDIQASPIASGWYAVVEGKVVARGIDDTGGIPPGEAIIEDFVNARGESHAKAAITAKQPRRGVGSITVPRADLDYLAALLAQPSVRRRLGAATVQAAIRKAVTELIGRIEGYRYQHCICR